jgi:hypothetical protein
MDLDEFIVKIDAQSPWVQWADISLPFATPTVSLRGRASEEDLAYVRRSSEELFDVLAVRARDRLDRAHQTTGIA